MAIRRALLGTASLAALMLFAACYQPNFGDDLDGATLPNRPASRDGDGGGVKASLPPPGATTDGADASVVEPTTAADASAPVDAAPARSALCSQADLVICYEMENAVKDSSVNALDPTTVQGVTFVAGKTGFGAALDSQSAIRFAASPLWTVPAGAATIERG